jgi:hypothetical protein
MANATTQLFLAGLLMVLPGSAGNPNGGQDLKPPLSGRSAGHCKPGSLPTVIIYLNEKATVKLYERGRAISIATRVFRGIGVDLDWREGAGSLQRGSSGCGPGEIIELQVDPTAVPDLAPDALAYAIPMRASGTRIHVVHDRVTAMSAQVPNLLGYVLAHEIAHVLQGVARHSDEGILKAKWDGRDYNLMGSLALSFSHKDAERIGNHLNRQHDTTD